MMKWVVRVVVTLVVLIVLRVGLQVVAAESGEVVTITAQGSDGEDHETRVWIAEALGSSWIRGAKGPDTWAARVAENPSIRLERGDSTRRFTARPETDPETRQQVNARFSDKYGWRDTLIYFLIRDPKHENIVLLRLEPAPEP